jgi:predicted aldo/keto reductase-like oxidoreductase
MAKTMEAQGKELSRRGFLQASLTGASALALGGVVGGGAAAVAAEADAGAAKPSASKPIQTRPLGKTGANVTILAMGGMTKAMSPQYIDQAWSMGIRYFDTAASYLHGRGEQQFAPFLAKYPDRRKQMFLASKCSGIHSVKDMVTDIDARLKQCGTSYLDVAYIHGLSSRFGAADGIDSLEIPKSPVFKEVCEKLKASGKVKFVGFSCHENPPAAYLQAAAEGGFVDVIMHSYDPFMEKGGAMDKAMDACHKAGIGLVAMKTARSSFKKVPAKLPELEKLGLTTRQGLLHACWSDPRLAATCIGIDNLAQMEENTKAAELYKTPLAPEIKTLLHQTVVASLPTMCPGCDGRCSEAAGKRELALGDIARLVSYYELDGNEEAREWYQALESRVRDASGADLAAATSVCMNRLDFAAIMEKANYYFA